MSLFIFDPTITDIITRDRGGGRIVRILKENLSDHAEFITDFKKITPNDTLFIPCFNPFQKPILSKRLARKQLIMVFDVIPLKYPSHFPVGIKGKINLFLNKKALRHYDTIITISYQSKRDIARSLNIPDEKIKVLYPPVSNVFLNVQNIIQPITTHSTNYCLYVGDVNWNKNLVNLAKAIKISDIQCVFVGKMFQKNFRLFPAKRDPALRETLDFRLIAHPWQKEFRDFLTEINDDPRFILAGYKSDIELIKLYQQACINILISRDEGFGFSYIEASTLGCPSILSNTDIFHEIAKDSALFANPDNPKDIARKIRQIFDDDALRTKLSFEAQKRAKYFNAEKFKKQLMSLF